MYRYDLLLEVCRDEFKDVPDVDVVSYRNLSIGVADAFPIRTRSLFLPDLLDIRSRPNKQRSL